MEKQCFARGWPEGEIHAKRSWDTTSSNFDLVLGGYDWGLCEKEGEREKNGVMGEVGERAKAFYEKEER